ncbi:MAG TPA: hypothetical protein VMW55_04525 [Nitrosopumilaceae archaeon]|nr:hypothetical protein [Nitrosopumilaceae archaeon]
MDVFVRLGIKSPNEFIQFLNTKNTDIQNSFIEQIQNITIPVNTKVMLGDATITEQKTFDPELVRRFYENLIKDLKDWTIQQVSISNNEDLRRIFTKFEIKEGNYLISGHLSLQYHVLLFYRPDQRVVEAQKELANIIDLTKNEEQQLSDNNDQLILDRLKEIGYKDFDHQKLFEIFFENNELREKIYKEIEEKSGVDFQQMVDRKKELVKELDNLLIETYQTSTVLIDDAKLVTGEEGCLCTFDIEFVKGGIKEGLFDPRKIPDPIKKKLESRVDEVLKYIMV